MSDVTNAEAFERASRSIPGGVNSPVRAFRSVGGTPYFVARAEGPYVWDVEGTRYIDLVQSYGAIILGHAHPAVVKAVRDAAGDGTSYGAPTMRETLLAEAIRDRVPSVRAGPLRELGHRSHHDRHPGGPWIHRPRRRCSSSPATTTATATPSWPRAVAAWPAWACPVRRG